MSEDKLHEDISRGYQASELVNNPLLVEMFDRYERNCIAAWKATDPLDTPGRESLWHCVVAAGKALEGLQFVASRGRFAQGTLNRMIADNQRAKND